MTKTSNKANKAEKKASIKSLVDKGIHIGLLAYTDNEPIAWCSIAPRETYRPLDGVQTDRKVWSLACFFIKRPYRNLGLSNLLLTQAIQFAKRNGAQCVEAYPVDTDSPSYRFMGFVPTFEKAGFNFIKRTGKRRNVMLLDIK
jgi:GNAT superfamily N-acetyltransferase